MELTPTTELQAVNTMLGTIGESPVSTLDEVTSVDTAIARDMLHAVSREVQSKGWWFNEDEVHTFVLNTEGRIAFTPNILSIRPLKLGASLVRRGAYIYDRAAYTDVFTEAPQAGVVWFFPFEELPESARRYITIRAARLFQTNVLGSESLDVFSEEHEAVAFQTFVSEHSDYVYAEGHNFMSGSADVYNIWNK